MKRLTLGDFLRTVRKAILHLVGQTSVILIVFGALFIGFSSAEITLEKILEWRPALLLPVLGLIVGYFFGWGLAIRLHIDSLSLRMAAFLIGSVAGAAISLGLLMMALYLAGLPAEADSILREPALLAALYVLFAVGGLFLSGVSYLTAGWTSYFLDFD